MKQLIAELLMLTAPMEKEKLIIYLAAAKEMLKGRYCRLQVETTRKRNLRILLMEVKKNSLSRGSIYRPKGMKFTYALRFRFDATNNEAEYEALIAGLWIAEQMGVQNLQANVDSRLVGNQVNGTYVAKEVNMI
ncbi:reverse transcriptase domain-containing protein [Tanacetum coccineum]